MLLTFGSVAPHVAWVFFNFGWGIVYVWLGWLTFILGLLLARALFTFGLDGLRLARAFFIFG